MPKIVDHEERRSEVLEATWRVIRTKGLEAATIREIAREAGVSNGVLAHYFTDKDDILVQAHRLAFSRVFERATAARTDHSGIEVVRTMLYEALPLDEVRTVEAIVDVSFLGRAITDSNLRDVRRESAVNARLWWLEQLVELQQQ